MKLRDYQLESVEKVIAALDKDVNPLLVAPTGSGKTVMACEIMNRWQHKHGKPCFFFAHRRELLEQAQATMDRMGVHGKALSVFTKQYMDVKEREGALCVFDEAHHAVAESWRNVETWFNGPKVAITATPDRLDRQCLSQANFTLVHEIAIRTLIEQGHLVRPMAQRLAVGVSDTILEAYPDIIKQVARNVVDEFARFNRKRAMVFLPSIEASENFNVALRQLGMDSSHVDGGMQYLRKQAVDKFMAGETQFLCSVALFTEGFDCPAVDCIVLLRETKSRALWSQMIGRGLRTHPGKEDCLILDPLWVSGVHSLTAADAFTLHPDSRAKPSNGTYDPMAVAEMTDIAAEDALIAKLRKIEAHKDAKEARERGLIDLSVTTTVLGFTLPPAEQDESEMMSWQKTLLESRHKVYVTGLTVLQADWLLKRLDERVRLNLASVKQVRKLKQFGHRFASTYTFDQATKAIGSDWRISGQGRFRKTFHK